MLHILDLLRKGVIHQGIIDQRFVELVSEKVKERFECKAKLIFVEPNPTYCISHPRNSTRLSKWGFFKSRPY